MSNFCFKVVWLNYRIGIAVDKKFKNNTQIPVTSFYFWPRVNGWELLKHELELKPWLLEEERIKILDGYTKIINNWKDSLEKVDRFNITELENELNFTLIAID